MKIRNEQSHMAAARRPPMEDRYLPPEIRDFSLEDQAEWYKSLKTERRKTAVAGPTPRELHAPQIEQMDIDDPERDQGIANLRTMEKKIKIPLAERYLPPEAQTLSPEEKQIWLKTMESRRKSRGQLKFNAENPEASQRRYADLIQTTKEKATQKRQDAERAMANVDRSTLEGEKQYTRLWQSAKGRNAKKHELVSQPWPGMEEGDSEYGSGMNWPGQPNLGGPSTSEQAQAAGPGGPGYNPDFFESNQPARDEDEEGW
jgi:hypothetical protein